MTFDKDMCFIFGCSCEKPHALNNRKRCIVCLEDFDNPNQKVSESYIGKKRQCKECKIFSFKPECPKCGKATEASDNPVIKHHVRYFPEIIAFVHYKCHAKIHDTENPLKSFIQYTPDDSKRFYAMQKS